MEREPAITIHPLGPTPGMKPIHPFTPLQSRIPGIPEHETLRYPGCPAETLAQCFGASLGQGVTAGFAVPVAMQGPYDMPKAVSLSSTFHGQTA